VQSAYYLNTGTVGTGTISLILILCCIRNVRNWAYTLVVRAPVLYARESQFFRMIIINSLYCSRPRANFNSRSSVYNQ
jgi:hypothetical protein